MIKRLRLHSDPYSNLWHDRFQFEHDNFTCEEGREFITDLWACLDDTNERLSKFETLEYVPLSREFDDLLHFEQMRPYIRMVWEVLERRSKRLHKFEENAEEEDIRAFLKDIENVCREHGWVIHTPGGASPSFSKYQLLPHERLDYFPDHNYYMEWRQK